MRESDSVPYLAKLALPRLRKLLAAVDAVPLDCERHKPWLEVRRLALEAIREHEELIRLAAWVKEDEAKRERAEKPFGAVVPFPVQQSQRAYDGATERTPRRFGSGNPGRGKP